MAFTNQQGRTQSSLSNINVTPLVDVVLVLLIIFMVVTPMLHRGVKIDLPTTEHHDKKQDTGEQLVIGIRGDGTYIETEKIPDEQLVERVRKELKSARPVHVRADKSLTYGDVRKVMEVARKAGAKGISLGVQEFKEK